MCWSRVTEGVFVSDTASLPLGDRLDALGCFGSFSVVLEWLRGGGILSRGRVAVRVLRGADMDGTAMYFVLGLRVVERV